MDTVLIVVDALRRSDVGCYDRPDDITPAIDRIAAEGTVYENAVSQSNYTDVCLSSIMSGQAPRGHGVLNHGASYTEESLKGIDEANTDFLPQSLSDAGVNTIGLDWLGRWHRWGYDEYGVGADGEDEAGLLDALKSLVKSLPEPAIELIKRLLVRVKDVPDPRADCEELTDLAIDGFERNPGDSFMFIHYWDVHPPFRPPEGYAEQFEFDGEDRPLSYYFQPDRKGKKGGEYASYVNGDRETLAESKLAYDGTISWVDEQIGRLYEYLKESDRLKETLFIVTADHGHYFGEHDIFSDNCSLYDPSIQIPLIIHHPGEDPGRVEETVQHTDLRPTIHEFHGISLPEDIRGNILPAETREYGFAEAEGEIMQTIRTPDWKLIRPLDIDYLNSQYWYEQDGEVELYDLSEDPGEMQNLAKERPTRVSALNGLLDTEIEEQQTIEHSGDRGERDRINQEEIEQIQSNLESLGYIEDG